MASGKFSKSPIASRVFVQEKCGKPWQLMTCASVSGLGIQSQVNESFCVGSDGKIQSTQYKKVQQGKDITWNVGGDYAKWAGLFDGSQVNGCNPNFLFVTSRCENPSDLGDPLVSDFSVQVKGVVMTSIQFGNDRWLEEDPANTDSQMWQFIGRAPQGNMTYHQAERYQIAATMTLAALDISFVDEGKCTGDGCGDELAGCRQIVAATGATGLNVSKDGGATWAIAALAQATVLRTFSNKKRAFSINATSVIYSGDAFVTANTSLFFTIAGVAVVPTTLSNMIRLPDGRLAIGDLLGAFYVSNDNGASFKAVRAPIAGQRDFRFLDVTPSGKIYALTTDALFAIYAEFSGNTGKTWGLIPTAPIAGAVFSGTSAMDIYATDAFALFVVNGRLFRTSSTDTTLDNCGNLTTQLDEIFVLCSQAQGLLTSIHGCDKNDCNDVVATYRTATGGIGIIKSIDGFASTSTCVCLPSSIIATGVVSAVVNPLACCKSKYGTSLFAAAGTSLIEIRNWASFFTDDIT